MTSDKANKPGDQSPKTILAKNALGTGKDSPVTTNGNTHYYNKFVAMTPAAKKMLWRDYYFGAVRTAANPEIINDGNPKIYSQGLFNFTGAVISRFADIEADAGVRAADKVRRINQMGYPGQIMSFDANLLDRNAPFFSTTNGRLSASQGGYSAGSIIRWTILSYVDRGAISQQK